MKLLALSSIRQQNLRKVLDLLTLVPAMTRLELAESAGLSQMTVTNLVDLLKEHEVLHLQPIQREDKSRPAKGRKAETISLCGSKKAWLIVDISHLQFSLTLLGFDVHPLLNGNRRTFESHLSTEAFMRMLGMAEHSAPENPQDALQRIALEEPRRYEEALEAMATVTAEMLHGVLWMLDPTHVIIDCVYARGQEANFVQAVERCLEKLFAGEKRILPQISPSAPTSAACCAGPSVCCRGSAGQDSDVTACKR